MPAALLPRGWRPRSVPEDRKRLRGPAQNGRRVGWHSSWLCRYPRQRPAHPGSNARPYSHCIYNARAMPVYLGLQTLDIATVEDSYKSLNLFGFHFNLVGRATSEAEDVTKSEYSGDKEYDAWDEPTEGSKKFTVDQFLYRQPSPKKTARKDGKREDGKTDPLEPRHRFAVLHPSGVKAGGLTPTPSDRIIFRTTCHARILSPHATFRQQVLGSGRSNRRLCYQCAMRSMR